MSGRSFTLSALGLCLAASGALTAAGIAIVNGDEVSWWVHRTGGSGVAQKEAGPAPGDSKGTSVLSLADSGKVEIKPAQSHPVDLGESEGASFELRDGEDRCLGSFWVFRTGKDNVEFTFAQDLVLAPEVRRARLAYGREPLSLDILEPRPGRFRPWSPGVKAFLFQPAAGNRSGSAADAEASSGERLDSKAILDTFAFLGAVPSTPPGEAPQGNGAARRGGHQHPRRGGRPAGSAREHQRRPDRPARGLNQLNQLNQLNPHAAPFVFAPGAAEPSAPSGKVESRTS